MNQTYRATAPDNQFVRLSTLVLIRWFAIIGQLITLVVVQIAFEMEGWLLLPLLVVGASVILNIVLTLGQPATKNVSGATASWHLGFDLLQLAGLMYLTGGLHNPFAFFFIAPVTVAAATLSLRRTILVVCLAVLCMSVVAAWHRPLPWPSNEILLPPLYVFGTWSALVLGTVFAALYTWRMAQEARKRAAALSAMQIALAHEQRMTAVGALAAAVAHEMSTPLGTICLVAKEIAEDLPADSPLADDVALLISQSERCRAILTQLGQQGEAAKDEAIDRVPLGTLAEIAAEGHRQKTSKELIFDSRPMRPGDDSPPPWVARRPEILHGLGNFIQNALQFADQTVTVEARWNADLVTVRVLDDGPGFPPHILGYLGEPYLSTRAGDGMHMGLGVFIAISLLARTGASVSFANQPTGGAAVSITWPRQALEQARHNSEQIV
ncbi:MAG: ActS/PrrB/RegB family redox-sensitive histidine kinase [Rhodospirillales bacterium]|nr:ActS/PrrB/RegB family redox-sensitive histidine kinase [Rhodospirillales bacterium]